MAARRAVPHAGQNAASSSTASEWVDRTSGKRGSDSGEADSPRLAGRIGCVCYPHDIAYEIPLACPTNRPLATAMKRLSNNVVPNVSARRRPSRNRRPEPVEHASATHTLPARRRQLQWAPRKRLLWRDLSVAVVTAHRSGSGTFFGFTCWPRPSASGPKNEPDPWFAGWNAATP